MLASLGHVYCLGISTGQVMTTAYVTCMTRFSWGRFFQLVMYALLYMYHAVYTVSRTTRDPGISSFVHDSDRVSPLMGCE